MTQRRPQSSSGQAVPQLCVCAPRLATDLGVRAVSPDGHRACRPEDEGALRLFPKSSVQLSDLGGKCSSRSL